MTDSISNIASAASQYARNSSLQSPGSAGDEGEKVSFGDLIRQGIEESVAVMETGEKASAQAITGNANIVDVVSAVNKAEMTLETVLSLRDRMVQAYNDVMSMPI